MNGKSRILACSCKHAEQDRIHGPGKRQHNQCGGGWRCIVCGKVKA